MRLAKIIDIVNTVCMWNARIINVLAAGTPEP